MLKGVNLHKMWIVMLINWNLPHGPNADDQRWHELRACMKACYKDHNHASCVLFNEYWCQIAREHEEAGFKFDTSSCSLQEAVWTFCKDGEDSLTKGYRCNMNRFLGSLAEAQKSITCWSKHLFERSYLALEKDMLHGTGFDKMVLQTTDAEVVDEGGGSTSSARVTMEAKSLRAYQSWLCKRLPTNAESEWWSTPVNHCSYGTPSKIVLCDLVQGLSLGLQSRLIQAFWTTSRTSSEFTWPLSPWRSVPV